MEPHYNRFVPSMIEIRKGPYSKVISHGLMFEIPINLSLLDYWICRFSCIFSRSVSHVPLGKQPPE